MFSSDGYTPHLLVLKESGDKLKDISFAVHSVEVTASVDGLPTMKLDFIPLPGVVEIDRGSLKIENETIDRSDKIIVAEIDHDQFKALYPDVGSVQTSRTLDYAGIVWMCGVVSDIMSSVTATSSSISAVVESELAELDTTLANQLFGIRSTGTSAGPIFVKGVGNTGATTTASSMTQDLLTREFINIHNIGAPILVTDPPRTTEEIYAETGRVVNLYTEFTTVDPFGNNPPPWTPPAKVYTFDDDVLAMSVNPNNIDESDASSEYVRIRPWELTRAVMVSAMRNLLPVNDTAGAERNIHVESANKLVDDIEALLRRVEADKGSDLVIMRKEFSDLVASGIIEPVMSAPESAVSVWKLALSIMHQFHMYFTPNVISSSHKQAKLGEFRVMNPYRKYTAEFEKQHVVSFQSTVPGYRSIIKSVGYETDYLIPTFVKNSDPSWTDALYLTYKPTQEDYITQTLETGVEPKFAVHGAVTIPPWISRASERIRRIHSKVTVSAGGGKVEDRDNTNALLVGQASSTSEADDFKKLAKSLMIYLRSAWQIFGRASVVSELSLVHTWPDMIRPLDVVVVNTGEGPHDDRQVVTGMVSSVRISWTAGTSYDTVIGLSHVTNLYDNYFRALRGTSSDEGVDNLDLYLKNHQPEIQQEA